MPAAKILVVDDEKHIRELFTMLLEKEGHEVTLAANGEAALELVERDLYDLIITDVKMPKMDGVTLLKEAKRISPETEVIVVTAYSSTSTAVEVMKDGAYDYINKPLKFDEVTRIIKKALQLRSLERENIRLRSEITSKIGYGNIIGVSKEMQDIIKMIKKIADTPTHVLVSGESGTGKELVARAIHDGSSRRDKPFVAINCAAIPEQLIESELFGHIKGSFTGAVSNKTGLFEASNGGAIFLDEIGELPHSMQAKMLRVIQEKRFRRVGGVSDISVDTRIISATNRDLQEEVDRKNFREDLYFRLNVIQIHIPPIRERRLDISHLIDFFIKKYSREFGKPVTGCTEEARNKLISYDFPGNVRELENIIERAIALESENIIGINSLPSQVINTQNIPSASEDIEIPPEGVDLEDLVAKFEKALILKALEATEGKKKRAADLLGINFRSFRYRLNKYGIESDQDGD